MARKQKIPQRKKAPAKPKPGGNETPEARRQRLIQMAESRSRAQGG